MTEFSSKVNFRKMCLLRCRYRAYRPTYMKKRRSTVCQWEISSVTIFMTAIFRSGFDLISLRYSSCWCCCSSSCSGDLCKKPKVPSCQIGLGWNLAGPQECSSRKYASTDRVRFFDTTSYVQTYDGHDVILRRKVLPSGECTRRVCPAHTQQRPSIDWVRFLTRHTIKIMTRCQPWRDFTQKSAAIWWMRTRRLIETIEAYVRTW